MFINLNHEQHLLLLFSYDQILLIDEKTRLIELSTIKYQEKDG